MHKNPNQDPRIFFASLDLNLFQLPSDLMVKISALDESGVAQVILRCQVAKRENWTLSAIELGAASSPSVAEYAAEFGRRAQLNLVLSDSPLADQRFSCQDTILLIGEQTGRGQARRNELAIAFLGCADCLASL